MPIATTDPSVAMLAGQQDVGHAGVVAFALDPVDGTDRFFVLWSDTGTTTVSLPMTAAQVEVVDLVPGPEGEFSSSTQSTAGGQVEIAVDADPLLVQTVPQ